MNQKLSENPKKYFKKAKTTAKSDYLQKLEDSLLALKVYGGITKTKIPLDIPEDDTRLSELELVFNSDHELSSDSDYEREASDLLIRYQKEQSRQKVTELTEQLSNFDEDSSEYESILTEINALMSEANN